MREADGTIAAGLHGWTWGGTGSRLLVAAETEAVRRGCHQMHLDTHSYQAPAFYRRLGYDVIGELPGWPGNDTRIFLRKTLA